MRSRLHPQRNNFNHQRDATSTEKYGTIEPVTAHKPNAGDISFRSFSFLHLLILNPNILPLIPRTGSSSKTLAVNVSGKKILLNSRTKLLDNKTRFECGHQRNNIVQLMPILFVCQWTLFSRLTQLDFHAFTVMSPTASESLYWTEEYASRLRSANEHYSADYSQLYPSCFAFMFNRFCHRRHRNNFIHLNP